MHRTRDIYIVHIIDVTKSFLRGVYQVGTQLCTKYPLVCYKTKTKRHFFLVFGLIGKDQTFPLLLENEKGAKERFRDQFVAPPRPSSTPCCTLVFKVPSV